MSSFSQVYDLRNLRRAYRWVLSNPDARYKNFFRDDYAAYALASELNLRILSRQIKSGRFTPSHSSKLYLPKTNGILRPISLLTVNDQVAYQACVNVIAEELHKRTTKRHRQTVFYHLYGGASSPFFYLKWENSYAAYANAIRTQFANGLKYVASFDLTAFYDSIDHHVLRVFLRRIGVDVDTTTFLLGNLRHWTEATWSGGASKYIYHEHGIPQGPSCSGMLSEVVLQHLDAVGDGRSRDMRYLRYVDDIKLMARDEKTLRRKLTALDIAAKQVGLFPQGSKVALRVISDPEVEIKSVSIPPEPGVHPLASSKQVQARMRALANRGDPTNTTRFKYVLPRLTPSSKTNSLLFRVLQKRPDLSEVVTRHFAKYPKLPSSLASSLIGLVLAEGVYHSVNADLLNLLYGRINGLQINQVADFAYERLFAGRYRSRKYSLPQPTYKAALIKWALLSARTTFADADSLIRSGVDWWVQQETVNYLDEARFGRPSFEALLNTSLRVADADPARVAASKIFANSLTVYRPIQECHWAARLLLRNAGLIPYAGRAPSLIPAILGYTVKFTQAYNWERLFGVSHNAAERLAIVTKQRFETDIDAFIVSLDSFCDLVTREIYRHHGYSTAAAYGNVLGAGAPAWLRAAYPDLLIGFKALHDLRIRSFTAHPRHRTGALNKRITHRQFFRIRRSITAAFNELSRVLPL